ncbi:MAG TPA: YkgJ family cysteine cluster protein [Candidatus Eisenbacteria bacterium]|nr:YkgJ family cysteine cluster protein [Candidatus Eisenbacteria bacterium]
MTTGGLGTNGVQGLERQLERGGVRTQSLFNRTFERLSEVESMLLGLLDVLLARGVVTTADIEPAVRRIEEQVAARGDEPVHAVALRSDDPEAAARPDAVVDCAARMHVCHAVCCKLAVKLDATEVESGRLRWDLGRPYYLRKEADGRCTHQDRPTGGCGVYADRPKPCRQYSCANDGRIWKDFDGMVLNDEWLATHFRPDEPQFIAIEPLRRP